MTFSVRENKNFKVLSIIEFYTERNGVFRFSVTLLVLEIIGN